MTLLTHKRLIGIVISASSLLALPSSAGQSSGQFDVNITLQSANSPSAPKKGFCTKNSGPLGFGAVLTIVCSTGAIVDIAPSKTGAPWAPMHGGSYRFIFQATNGIDSPTTVDGYIGAGSVTSWRVVNLADRDYLEMLVGW